jgi:guanine nucleotide-binding protein subunit alpha
MGCGMSTEDKEGKARNEEIENQLKRDKMMQRNEIKMLLLGMKCILNLRRGELTCEYRSRRVGQVHNPQADEAHPRGWILS